MSKESKATTTLEHEAKDGNFRVNLTINRIGNEVIGNISIHDRCHKGMYGGYISILPKALPSFIENLHWAYARWLESGAEDALD